MRSTSVVAEGEGLHVSARAQVCARVGFALDAVARASLVEFGVYRAVAVVVGSYSDYCPCCMPSWQAGSGHVGRGLAGCLRCVSGADGHTASNAPDLF